ncbi:di-trans,poly-cis-decaprenylcistransferase [Candidatus Microgenomates bacterium]|nr:di-trans,poly-cis-decaprenylcistransferase [Candidatus Microgenomates bacterium]
MAELQHIAIIPDGNRRWARARNMPTLEGHRRGFSALEKMANHIRKRGIHTLTVWAFSTENWNREKDEITYLMKLYETWLNSNLRTAVRDKVRIIHLGRKDRIPESLRKKLIEAEEKTKSYTQFNLGFAVDYGGRDEIARAFENMKNETAEVTDKDQLAAYLDTRDFTHPFPDLVIRTSGEHRTSGFMTWQTAYSEWIFHDKYLPDFTIPDLDLCIQDYQNRQRRFGK